MIDDIRFINVGNTTLMDFIFDNNEYKHEIYVEGMQIDNNDVFIINCLSNIEQVTSLVPYLEKGMKFILDKTWETYAFAEIINVLKNYSINAMSLLGYGGGSDEHYSLGTKQYIPMFFWYNEFLHYKRNLENVPLAPIASTTNFLMPIRLNKHFRDKFIKLLDNRIEKSIYSQVYLGRYLPGDDAYKHDDRYNNPQWYSNTGYSVVLETSIDDVKFITEKTFKPIANGHPFIVLGSPGILKVLQNYGFQTFDSIIDESYDDEHNLSKKMDMIINLIDNMTLDKLRDMRDIVVHNKNHFFDEELVMHGINHDIRIPIERFCIG